MPRLYDHIDLRIHSLAEARRFYESLLPALGFTRKTEIPGWLQYEAEARLELCHRTAPVKL